MKPGTLLLCIVLSLFTGLLVSQSFAVGQSKSKLRTTHDQFTDTTSTATKELQIVSGGSVNVKLIASFSYSGRQHRKPEGVTLLFIVLADDWLFLEPPTIRALIGSDSTPTERLSLGTARVVTAKVLVGRYVRTREAVNIKVPTAEFVKMAQAQRLQLQLRSGLEFEIKGKAFQQLKELAGLISGNDPS